jgi:hypothetical protein
VVSPRPTAGSATRRERPLFERLPVGVLNAVETILLGVVAAALVLYVFPDVFAIESSCLGETGQQTTVGDTYIAAFVMLGTLGWLGVFLATIFASIADRRDVVVLLPVVWFLALVLTALAVAVVIGPVSCPT